MKKFVALYRGINVGGKALVPMAALREMHAQLGHGEVASYIQSGNLVFAAAGTAVAIARKTAAAFSREFGFAAKLMVLPADRWQELVEQNPFAQAADQDPTQVHLGLCAGEPNAASLQALLAKTGGREKFAVCGEAIFLHAPAGVGASKFVAGLERAAGVPVTLRNWRTVAAISKLLVGG